MDGEMDQAGSQEKGWDCFHVAMVGKAYPSSLNDAQLWFHDDITEYWAVENLSYFSPLPPLHPPRSVQEIGEKVSSRYE